MAARKTPSKAEPREPFVLGEESIRAGTTRALELPVARMPPGTWTRMPAVVVHGSAPGPTVWLSGAVHGDELNGVEIVRRLLTKFDPRKLAGTLLAVPIVNVFGVTTSSRYLPDRRDLNRSFPGSRRGSLASRLAHIFFENIAVRCELGLDFHTGSGGRTNLPQVRCDLDDPATRKLGETFAPDVLLHSTLRDGSLRAAARKRDIRVLLYEGGEAFRFDENAITRGVEGALRVLHGMEMIDDDLPELDRPVATSRDSKWMRAGRSGFCHADVELGETVSAGQCVATITDGVSAKGLEVHSRIDGIVIGLLQTALVHRGDAVIHIAQVERG